jgi:hypothetical protein
MPRAAVPAYCSHIHTRLFTTDFYVNNTLPFAPREGERTTSRGDERRPPRALASTTPTPEERSSALRDFRSSTCYARLPAMRGVLETGPELLRNSCSRSREYAAVELFLGCFYRRHIQWFSRPASSQVPPYDESCCAPPRFARGASRTGVLSGDSFDPTIAPLSELVPRNEPARPEPRSTSPKQATRASVVDRLGKRRAHGGRRRSAASQGAGTCTIDPAGLSTDGTPNYAIVRMISASITEVSPTLGNVGW